MGHFLGILSKQKKAKPQVQFFKNNSLTKINQYYCLYKNISDTFAIDDTEFIDIFGDKMDVFQVLDTDKNLLVDGLQLFVGLALLSDQVKFQDKICFLFTLFDFNDLKSLSKTDLQFLFLSCCTIVHKLFGLRSQIKQQCITEFIREEFTGQSRINISQIFRWVNHCDLVTMFLELITKKPQKNDISRFSSKIYLTNRRISLPSTKINPRVDEAQEEWLLNFAKIVENKTKNQQLNNSDIRVKVNWVYGIRTKDIRQLIQIVTIDNSEWMVYLVSKFVVLYNIKSQMQRHYASHTQQIISITCYNNLIASGQYGKTPAIHIWNCKTLETKKIIMGVHRIGIHLLKFFKQGQYLLTCGCGERSPILIYCVETQQIIYSLYCESPAVDIARLYQYITNQQHSLVVAHLYGVKVISQEAGKIKCLSIDYSTFTNSRITCCAYYIKNQKLKYLRHYDDDHQAFVVTGHQQGQIFVTKLSNLSTHIKLSQEKCEVRNIIPTQSYIIINTDSSFIDFYDIDLMLKCKLKTIDISQLSHNLNSYDVDYITPLNSQSLLVITNLNDIIIIGQERHQQSLSKYKLIPEKYQTKQLSKIINIKGFIKTHKMVYRDQIKSNIVYFGGSEGVIWGVNTHTHQICDLWNIGQQIQVIDGSDCIGLGMILIAGSSSGKLYIRLNLSECNQKLKFTSDIKCLSISVDHETVIVGCKDCQIYVLNNSSKGSYIIIKKINLLEVPTSISLLNNKFIIATTQENQNYIVNLEDSHFKLIQQIPESQINILNPIISNYYNHKNYKLTVIFGCQIKALLAARFNGNIDIWKNTESLYHKNTLSLKGHNSICSQISLSEDQKLIYSTGFCDNMMVQWKLEFCVELPSPYAPKRSKIQPIQNFFQEFIQRQLRYCMFTNNILSETYDEHLHVRGVQNQTLSILLRGMMEEWRLANQAPNSQHPPPISLNFDYIYGIQTYNKRSTVHILNHPKRFIYFVSRFIIIYNPVLNVQSIYTGHRFKVTCLVPVDDHIVVSGQSCYKPCIRVWDSQSLQTLRVIDTIHRFGIIYLDVDRDRVISYGFSLKQPLSFSLQLSNLSTGCFLASRNQQESIASICFNPNNLNEFVTTGYNNVTFWKSFDKNIYRESVCHTCSETITCCLVNSINPEEIDVIVGNKKGQIGIVVKKRKYIVLKQNAHGKQINLIKKINRDNQPYFISCSEDETIKIWDRKFVCLYTQFIRKIQFQQHQNCYLDKRSAQKIQQRNLSVQSLSILQNQNELIILVATRNGDVIQLMESLPQDNSHQSLFNSFQYTLFLKSHSAQHPDPQRNKIIIAHHPKYQIIVSISEDQNLLFWDSQKNKLIVSKILAYSAYPTAMKFTKDGQYLIIGYSDGFLMFIDCKISKSFQGKTDQKYILPNLTVVKRQSNREGSAVLNMEFSDSGDHLAVSFHNKMNKSLQSGENEQSYIALFLNKGKQKSKHFGKIDSDKIFEKLKQIPRQHNSDNVFMTQNNSYSMAAYSIAFAEFDGKHYLLIYYQLIDSHQNRLNYPNDGKYVVWDVNSSTVIANFQQISMLNWKKFIFSNSIYAKYQFHSNILSSVDIPQKQPINNNLLIPYMSAMCHLSNYLILGSINGDLHLVKTSSLEYEESFDHSPTEEEFFIAKTYPAHCGQINQIQTNLDKNVIYTTGVNDQCVVKWKIDTDKTLQYALDNKQPDEADIFGEVPNLQTLLAHNEYYLLKENLKVKTFQQTDFRDRFKVKQVIGRKSFTLRNNLKIDCNGRMIYSSGHCLVAYDKILNSKEFIYDEENEYKLSQQVSIILMSNDRRIAYVFHNGIRTTLAVWELNSKIPIKKIIISNICHVLLASLSKSNNKMVIYGLDKTRNSYLMMFDIQKQQVLGVVSYAHKKPWVIKAINFLPSNENRFITCGAQQTKLWQLIGNKLVDQDQTKKPQYNKLINLSMVFVDQILITGCEEGSIIVWGPQIVRKIEHSDAVLVLHSHRSSMLISGGKDSYIVIWQLMQGMLTMVRKMKLDSKIQSPYIISNCDLQIQSLCSDQNNLLIGTRTGSIYSLSLSSTNQLNQPINQFKFYDNQTPKAFFLCYVQSEVYLYAISDEGQLNLYSINDYKMIHCHDFDQETIQMLQSDKNNIFYIAFRQQIHCYNSIVTRQNYKLGKLRSCFNIKNITHILLSKNQKMMAVGIENNSDHQLSIKIYDVTSDSAFKLLFRIPLSDKLMFIDFSTQNRYIFVKTVETQFVRDLTVNNNQNLPKDQVAKIDWHRYGLISSPKTQKLRDSFAKDNNNSNTQIVKIIEIQPQKHLIFDSFGGIFYYQAHQLLIAQSRINVSELSRAQICNNMKYIAIGSQFDKNIVILELQR